MTNKPEFVFGTDCKDTIDRAIALPKMLISPDGRVFDILSWEPSVTIDKVITVKLDASIRMERK